MRLAVVERAGTVVLNEGEELDSWSTIIDGQVEVTQRDGSVVSLEMGDRYVTVTVLGYLQENEFNSCFYSLGNELLSILCTLVLALLVYLLFNYCYVGFLFVCLSYMVRTDRRRPTGFLVRCSAAQTSLLFI